MRIIQISDTHLSRRKRHFAANWPPLAAWIVKQHPDLVIHTGDVTVDGVEIEDDLEHAAELMRQLGARFRAVPGNHDVGEAGHPNQPIDDQSLGRWRTHFGPDRWAEDVEGFRLIGLDALLFGSGHAEEAAQMDWLASVVAEASGRRLAWFLHRPLFIESPFEGDTGYWSVKPQQRAILLDVARRCPPALIASGHLHKAHQMMREGTRYIWGPASSFLVGPDMQPPMPGEKLLGAVRYDFDGTEVKAEIVEVPGLAQFWLDDVIDEVYPRSPAAH